MSTQRTWHTRGITTVSVKFGDAHFRLSRIMTTPSALEFVPPCTGDQVLWKTSNANGRIMTTPWVLDSPRCEGCAKTLDLTHSENTLNLALSTQPHPTLTCMFLSAVDFAPKQWNSHLWKTKTTNFSVCFVDLRQNCIAPKLETHQ